MSTKTTASILPEEFKDLWTAYILPHLTQLLGKEPKIELEFKRMIDFKGQAEIATNLVAFLAEISELAAEKAIKAQEEIDSLKDKVEELKRTLDYQREDAIIGRGVSMIIRRLRGGQHADRETADRNRIAVACSRDHLGASSENKVEDSEEDRTGQRIRNPRPGRIP